RGLPLFLAPGDHAVASTVGPARALDPLTGTSVSALVASAAASALWYNHPRDTSRQLDTMIRMRMGPPTDPTAATATVPKAELDAKEGTRRATMQIDLCVLLPSDQEADGPYTCQERPDSGALGPLDLSKLIAADSTPSPDWALRYSRAKALREADTDM